MIKPAESQIYVLFIVLLCLEALFEETLVIGHKRAAAPFLNFQC